MNNISSLNAPDGAGCSLTPIGAVVNLIIKPAS